MFDKQKFKNTLLTLIIHPRPRAKGVQTNPTDYIYSPSPSRTSHVMGNGLIGADLPNAGLHPKSPLKDSLDLKQIDLVSYES